jgi:hypothetical protein
MQQGEIQNMSRPVDQTFQATTSSGYNSTGANLTISGGRSTGLGPAGALYLATANAGTVSNNTANAVSNRVEIYQYGAIRLNPPDINTNLLTLDGGVVTNSQPVLSLSQTWSNSSAVFTGIKATITDSNSASTSLFADFQSNAVSVFSVDKRGAISSPYARPSSQSVMTYGASTSGFQLLSGTSAENITAQTPAGAVIFSGTSSRFSVAGTLSVGSTAPAVADCFIGRETSATHQFGIDAATPTDQTLKAADGSGTDKNGAALTVVGGKSTGAGAGGALVAKTSLTGGGGSSSANNHSTRGYTYAAEKSLTDATATGILDVVIDSGKYLGGDLFITFVAKDGFGGWSVNTVRINVSAYNDAGTVNAAYSTQQSSVIHAATGTETITFTTSNPASGTLRLSATFTSDSWAEVPTDIRAKWQFVVNSDSEAPVTPL